MTPEVALDYMPRSCLVLLNTLDSQMDLDQARAKVLQHYYGQRSNAMSPALTSTFKSILEYVEEVCAE